MVFTLNEITAAWLDDEKINKKELNISSCDFSVGHIANSMLNFCHHSISDATLLDGGGVELLQVLN